MNERRTLLVTVEIPASINERSVVSNLSAYMARYGGTITGWTPVSAGVRGRRFVDRAIRRAIR